MPEVSWDFNKGAEFLELRIKTTGTPAAVRLWTARSASPDFRESQWSSQPLNSDDGNYLAKVPRPDSGHVALFGEVHDNDEFLPFSVNTLMYWE